MALISFILYTKKKIMIMHYFKVIYFSFIDIVEYLLNYFLSLHVSVSSREVKQDVTMKHHKLAFSKMIE